MQHIYRRVRLTPNVPRVNLAEESYLVLSSMYVSSVDTSIYIFEILPRITSEYSVSLHDLRPHLRPEGWHRHGGDDV